MIKYSNCNDLPNLLDCRGFLLDHGSSWFQWMSAQQRWYQVNSCSAVTIQFYRWTSRYLKENTNYTEDNIKVGNLLWKLIFPSSRGNDNQFASLVTKSKWLCSQEWYNGFISDCPSGKLSQQSFIKIYSKFFPSGNATLFCEHIFRSFDSDNNGSIDFKEFLLAINITSNGSPQQKLDWAFRLVGENANIVRLSGWANLNLNYSYKSL